MGWNTWIGFGFSLNENIVKREAQAMVSSGMKAAGYDYLVVDGGWETDRDANGNLQADPTKFPHGIKALADYVYHLGLKFGIHIPAGVRDCQNKLPGTQSAPGGAQQNADQPASWGVDFLKHDLCTVKYPPGLDDQQKTAFRLNLFSSSIQGPTAMHMFAMTLGS